MTDRLKLSLSSMWLIASLFSLALPVFLPSSATAPGFVANSIGTATATMFILSFPSSLFGIPLLFVVDHALGVDMNSLQGMYVNLMMLFVLGLIQWFWILPRVWQPRDADVQRLNLPISAEEIRLPEGNPGNASSWTEGTHPTPLERALRDDLN